MADTGYVLSEEDIELLRWMKEELLKTSRGGGDNGNPPTYDDTPDTYIAKAPVSGISAISGSTPGSADVDVYGIEFPGGVPTLTNLGFSVAAYNLSTADVGNSSWITITRDKYGCWLVVFEAC